MHSFQPSRGRIFFEVLCALTISASLAGAWFQTGATALLAGAGALLLYALVHLFDMRRRSPVAAAEPQRIDFEAEVQADVPAQQESAAPMAAADLKLAAETASEEVEVVEPVAPRPGAGRRKGGSRKSSGRRASVPKLAKVAGLATLEAVQAAEPALPEVADVTVSEPADQAEAEEFEATEPVAHVPHAPLFEPEPFVRMPRQAFGRRGRI